MSTTKLFQKGASMVSLWDELGMDSKVNHILDVRSHVRGHHFGRPFLTAYQIAIAFCREFPAEFKRIGKPVGGRKIGQSDSLAQYIALQLSKRIKDGRIQGIEGRFLHRANLKSLKYQDGGSDLESSSLTSYDLSLFRLRN
jgi:hypothetical protein